MRYSDRCVLISPSQQIFDYETGDTITVEGKRELVACNISKVGLDRVKQLFGELDRQMIIVRLQGQYKDDVSFIEIDDTKHKVYRKMEYRKDVAFYVEGEYHDQ